VIHELSNSMGIKTQDILVALKLSLSAEMPGYVDLGKSLGISASEAHAAVRRLTASRLLDPETKRVRIRAFRNFLIHGVPYAFPAHPKEVTRGIPTAWAAPVFGDKIKSGEMPPVWPDPEGSVQGTSVEPLYSSAPGASQRDPALYDLLTLVDAMRFGRARERAFAEKEIDNRLGFREAA
jgi:hypothetical protein